MWPTTSPGDRLEAATRTVVADLCVAHGQLLASSGHLLAQPLPGPGVQTVTACGLRSWSEPGTGSDGSAPRATIRLSWSTCTTLGRSARAWRRRPERN